MKTRLKINSITMLLLVCSVAVAQPSSKVPNIVWQTCLGAVLRDGGGFMQVDRETGNIYIAGTVDNGRQYICRQLPLDLNTDQEEIETVARQTF